MAAGLEAQEEGVRRQKFFKILLPGTFESTLCLPPNFAAVRLDCPVVAMLRDAAGKSWDVQLARCGGQSQQALCFAGTGWRSFVRANRLAPGNMLVFEHRGGLHFSVDLFDQSGCLKDDVEVDDDDDDMESGNAAAWRRAFGGGMKKRKRSRSPAEAAGSCGVEEEQEDVLHRQIARSYQLRFLDLSKSLCERMGWTSSRSVELRLLQQMQMQMGSNEKDGRRWLVSVKVSGKGGMICGGWMAFAKDNDLRLNDTCVFKPHDPPPRRLLHDGSNELQLEVIQVQLLRTGSGHASYLP